MLHGLEAPADGSATLWWLGAFHASVLVSGGELPAAAAPARGLDPWCGTAARPAGGVVALGPIGLLMR
jgi:urease accessory protein